MKNSLKFIFFVFLSTNSHSQWQSTGLNPPGTGNTFGTSYNAQIDIYTNNNFIGYFSVNNGLAQGLNAPGDGLRIRNQDIWAPPSSGELDMFTSSSNGTEIRWGLSGNIRGANNRFEEWAHMQGFFFNTSAANGMYKFARSGNVTAFVGTNNYWRIGMQNDPSNYNGERRLHVLDNTQQFRLTYANPNDFTGLYTDFFSNSFGNLQIQPVSGKVGINAPTNPTATIDVFGDARIRSVVPATVPDALIVGVRNGNPDDMSVRQLDFPNISNWVLLGNGQFGPVPGTPPNIQANNGTSKLGNHIQLGEPYNSAATVPLLNDREVRLDGNNFVFSDKGAVGIGQAWPQIPTEKLDVVGNARFRTVPVQGGQSLILGLQQGGNINDIELSRLALPNDSTQVLLGNGSWGIISSSPNVHNGASLNSSTIPNYIAFGQNIGDPANLGQLLNDREVPCNNNNIYFTDNTATATNKNRIGFGTTSPQARVHVQVNSNIQESFPTGIHIENNQVAFNGISRGLRLSMNSNNIQNMGQLISVSGPQTNIGIETQTVQVALENDGIIGRAYNGTNINNGIIGEAISLTNVGNLNYGITGIGRSGIINYGGFFSGTGNNQINYGVKVIASGNSINNYGIYAQAGNNAPNNYAGWFQGNVNVTGGSLTVSGSPVLTSDQLFKENVEELSNAMALINSLQPKTFTYKTTEFESFGFETDQQMGLIAQEVEQVLPTIVSDHIRPAEYDSLGNQLSSEFSFKGVEYEELITLLIAGFQEQDARIDSLMNSNNLVTNYSDSLELVVADLNDRLTHLENCLSNILPALCNANQVAIQQTPEETQEYLEKTINITLSSKNNIILNQNVPNPFAESTVITYTVPATVQKAQIHFYDGTGKLINTVEVTERGNGQLNVFANDLSSGVYTYSLVADGQVMATKRMVKE